MTAQNIFLPEIKKIAIYLVTWVISYVAALATPEKPNLQDDIMPIFESKCNSCHNADRARGGLDLTNMNAIMVGGSSGESVISGDGENSYLYKLIARVEKPYMPQREDKMPQSEIDLIKKWIDLGLLPTATGKPIQKKKSNVNLALGNVSVGKPDGPPPMPQYLSLEPSVVTKRPFAPSAMASAPWSPLVAVAGQKQVLLYNTDTLRLMGVLPFPEGFIESLAFSRNGKLIVAGGGRGGKSGRVAAWEVESGNRVLTMGEEYDAILTADLSADQSLLAIGSPSKLVKVYDVASNELVYEIKKHSEWITQVAFSPDGILLATADRNGGLHIWEAETGNPFYTLDGHKEEITDLSWRADSNILVSASEEGSVRTWEMINGKQLKTWNAHSGGTLSVYFDPSGKIVTSGRDKLVKLWQGDGNAIKTIKDFKDIVMEACYSQDGSRVIAGDWSGRISVWNAIDGSKIGELSANPPEISDSLKQAKIAFEDSKLSWERSRSTHELATKSLHDAKTLHDKNMEALTKAKSSYELSFQLYTANQNALKEANLILKKKAEDKSEKNKAYYILKADLKMAESQLLKDNQVLASESVQQKEQLALLTSQKEAHKKIFPSVKDSNKTQDYIASEQKIKKLETLVDQAIKKAQLQKGRVEQTLLSQKSIEQKLAAAEKNLSSSTNSYNIALEQKKKLDQERIEKTKNLELAKSQLPLAKSNFAKSQEALDKAKEAFKKPEFDFVLAEKNFKQAQNELSRWNAEVMNVERHIELRNLKKLKSELSDYEMVLNESKELRQSAEKAFKNISESLVKLPDSIARNKELLIQKKNAVTESEKRKVSVIQVKEEKNLFIKDVNRLAALAHNKSQAQKPDSTFGQASGKLQETLTLLKKDLSETENLLASREQEIMQAKDEVIQLEKVIKSEMKLLESAPLLIKEKQLVLDKAKSQEMQRQQEFDLVTNKLDQQSAKAELLLEKYLGLLPQS